MKGVACAIGTLALLLAAPAAAHRGHASLSVVEIDAMTGEVTVTHRMAAHDTEPALAVIVPDAQPNLDDPAARLGLAAHAQTAFRVWDGDGKRIPLDLVETDLAGDDVRLVYHGASAVTSDCVFVDSDLMVAAYGDQENQVNVRTGKVTKTALFRRDTGIQQICFP